MTDQAEQLRLLVEQSAEHDSAAAKRRIVIVAGAGSGVGTTTLAINLAIAIARNNASCVLADLNYVRPQIALACRLRPKFATIDLLQARRQVGEVLQCGPCGIQVLPGQDGLVRNHESAIAVTQKMKDVITRLAASNVVIVDAGAGFSVALRGLADVAADILLATSEDTQTVMDCYGLVKRICQNGSSSQLASIVNFAARYESARDVHARLAVSCDRFLNLDFRSAATIPDDPQIHEATCAGRPFIVYSPQSEATYQINALADHLLRTTSSSKRFSEAA